LTDQRQIWYTNNVERAWRSTDTAPKKLKKSFEKGLTINPRCGTITMSKGQGASVKEVGKSTLTKLKKVSKPS
jgi:hypothetical protein